MIHIQIRGFFRDSNLESIFDCSESSSEAARRSLTHPISSTIPRTSSEIKMKSDNLIFQNVPVLLPVSMDFSVVTSVQNTLSINTASLISRI